jgi:hypothetical protein
VRREVAELRASVGTGTTFEIGGCTIAPVPESGTDGTSDFGVVDKEVGRGADGLGSTVNAGVASGFAREAVCCAVSREPLGPRPVI